ncbi:MAG: DUF924 domain-containing protein [Erythrobacter sp.]|nr:DUF924 domain-containing protein [Erythrobacter sp.]
MTAAVRPWARELLYVWFERLGPGDWFGGGEAVDDLLERRFEHVLHAMGSQSARDFLGNRTIARAAILLFDQVPRNLYRDTAQAFAWDDLALALTHAALRKGWLAGLSQAQKQFLLMPLMHSEAIADQELSLRLFTRHVPSAIGFARSHHRMIARFGRFPHRNAILDRESTAAEKRAIEAGFSW